MNKNVIGDGKYNLWHFNTPLEAGKADEGRKLEKSHWKNQDVER